MAIPIFNLIEYLYNLFKTKIPRNLMVLLIVDDNVFMRSLIRQIVSSYFTEIIECADGFEAIQTYKLKEPDWVLMDIEMPIIDGLTATDLIRKIYPKAKIVIVTKHDDELFRAAAAKAGAIAFASKDNLFNIWSLMKD